MRAHLHSTVPGTGLGLTLVSAILHAHHGTVELDASHERGTRIIARLPLHNPGASHT